MEQKIKEIKGVGGVTGITQKDDILHRFFLTVPYITKMVNDFIEKYSVGRQYNRTEYYQLSGNISCRIAKHAATLKKSIEIHCEGNPFSNLVPMIPPC